MIKRQFMFVLGLSLSGVISSTLAKDVRGLRVCNETGEKLYMTVNWILPGESAYSFLTREAVGTKSHLGFFSSKCRVFGPVSEIHSVTWFTESQWHALSKDIQTKLQGKDRSTVGVNFSKWYKPSFADSNLRRITLSKDKGGKIYVKEDKEWSLNPVKLGVFKKLNPFKNEEEDL